MEQQPSMELVPVSSLIFGLAQAQPVYSTANLHHLPPAELLQPMGHAHALPDIHGITKPRLAWPLQGLFLVVSTPTPTMLAIHQIVFVILLTFGTQPAFAATSTAV